ncbi:MAG: type III ribulose-bisphosphate carboxylase [Candidatus Nanoarchaeia archaeon]|nr:type III ribulose-bisphosphate carboxylase [Candidatus Nanoarchaeia archaeon]
MSQYLDFVDFKYKPSKDDVICLFRFEPGLNVSIKEAIGRIASESSNGTWTELSTLKPHIRKIRARAFEVKNNFVKIAYPIELFELGNMPQLYSSVAGNIFGMKALKNLRLEDIDFSEKYIKSFKGPQFGIDGVRKFMNIYNRPLTATVPKPKVGMTTEEHAKVLYDAWIGGVDFGKDDENLTNQNFNKFENRVKLCAKMRDKAEKETGEKKDYFINITAETKEMIRRANIIKKYNFKYMMIDILTAGWSGLQTLRDESNDLKLAIHAHRAMHAAFTRNPKHGISMLTIAKCSRLVGVDNMHIGTAVGKLVSPIKEVLGIEKEITGEEIEETIINNDNQILQQEWYNIKPTLPVSSGGLHPGLVPYIIKMLGKDCVLQLGGGIHGHPNGTKAGAIAFRQAIESTLTGNNLRDYAKTHNELKLALDKWGFHKPI